MLILIREKPSLILANLPFTHLKIWGPGVVFLPPASCSFLRLVFSLIVNSWPNCWRSITFSQNVSLYMLKGTFSMVYNVGLYLLNSSLFLNALNVFQSSFQGSFCPSYSTVGFSLRNAILSTAHLQT